MKIKIIKGKTMMEVVANHHVLRLPTEKMKELARIIQDIAESFDDYDEEIFETDVVAKIGDRVRIVKQINGHDHYPWVPDLVGKEGSIVEVLQLNDGSVFTIKMDQSFERGRPEEDEYAYGCVPKEKEIDDIWHFVAEELEIL